MKAFIQKALQALVLVPVLALGVSAVVPATVGAAASCSDTDLSISSGANCAQGTGQADNLFGNGGIFQKVTNILLFLVGAISVIMLIIGGIRYVVSGGDQAAVTSAKNTILYAIVGIVVAFLAYAAVAFVTNSLKTA
jgi:hypothetical protein